MFFAEKGNLHLYLHPDFLCFTDEFPENIENVVLFFYVNRKNI